MKYAAWNRSGRIRRIGLPSWQLALILIAAFAIGLAVAVVATGVFLIVLPVALLAALAYRLFGPRRRRGGSRVWQGRVIEGEYEVVDGAEPAPSHRRESRRP
jgi:predicted membrane metal-binding protein